MVSESLNQSWGAQGISYQKVDSKFMTYGTNQIIKVTYKLTDSQMKRLTTNYVVSTPSETIGIVVNNAGLEDFEGLIKEMK